MGSAPIHGAHVELWAPNHLGLVETRLPPIAEDMTTEDGNFSMEIDIELHPQFIDAPYVLLHAYGGEISPRWQQESNQGSPRESNQGSPEDIAYSLVIPFAERPPESLANPLAADAVNVWAVIPGKSPIGPYTDIVLSPITTVAKELSDARLAAGKASTYPEAMEQAHQLIGEHFQISEITRLTPPAPRLLVSPLDEDMHHLLVLQGMSSLARQMYQAGGERPEMNIFTLTRALSQDAHGPDAIFDGIGPDGLSVCLEPCTTGGALHPDTLRTELVRALARDYLRSPVGARVSFADIASLLLSIASNTEPELFGDALPGPLDDQPPQAVALESLVLDERLDSVTFDSETLAPQHSHSTEAMDLAQGFDGGPCPDVYKHVHLMDSLEDNPLRLRYRVSDDIVGIDDQSVFAVLTVDDTGEEFPVPARVIHAPVEGWREYEFVLLRDQVPILDRREGMFTLTIHASDWLGNTEPVSTCWIHKPLAPPVWVSEPRVADQADSLAAVSLSGDDNNLAPLLSGVPLDLGKALVEFEIANGTAESAYVTLDYTQPSALYSKSWTDTYAVLYKLYQTSCIHDMACTTDRTLDIRNYHSVRGSIAEPITGIRVWDTSDSPAVEVFPCNDCDAHEYHIEPRIADGVPRRYRVALITTRLSELAPVDSGEPPMTFPPMTFPPMTFMDLPIHPVYQPMTVTGSIGQTVAICAYVDMANCREEVILQSYRAVTEVSISTGMLEARGRLSAAPYLSFHMPRPDAHTFGRPVRVSEMQWVALEDALPPVPSF